MTMTGVLLPSTPDRRNVSSSSTTAIDDDTTTTAAAAINFDLLESGRRCCADAQRQQENDDNNDNTTRSPSILIERLPLVGTVELRGKYRIRFAFQSLLFAALLLGYGVFHIYEKQSEPHQQKETQLYSSWEENGDVVSSPNHLHRFLELDFNKTTEVETPTEGDEIQQDKDGVVTYCSDLKRATTWWYAVLFIIGILYTFLALAIVCDEFFVPALEEMAGPRRLNLSMDVAGATLMAAGGSAPELATSLIGTFRESKIGFGTIVGSAVFNVLFVIGMCSILAKEVLTLTWWPLFRDCTYYTIGLALLATFTGLGGEIIWWESLILFLMYIGYILLMWQNKNLYKAITGKVLVYPDEEDDDESENNHNANDDNDAATAAASVSGGNGCDENKDGNDQETTATINMAGGTNSTTGPTGGEDGVVGPMRPSLTKELSKSSVASHASQVSRASIGSSRTGGVPHFRWQGTFRAGILRLLKDGDSWMDTAGAGIVAKIMGDCDSVFDQVDKDGNGHIDRSELKELFVLLEHDQITTEELEEVFCTLDKDSDGEISRKEFTEWYCRAEERIMSQVQYVFDQIDVNKSNTLDKEELTTLLATLDPLVSDEDVQSAMNAMHMHGSPDEIAFEEFAEWYKTSMLYEHQKNLIEEDIEGVWDNVKPPKDGGVREWLWYIICLPLVFALTITIPDVQRPGNGKWCYFSFFMSIMWIGGFSYFMVDWAEIIGNTFGIPSDIMGLTLLAAGTSVPDLLSSVIVARRGQGDMAVSSSVGSNIFDILVGLPLPWLLYSAVYGGKAVYIGSQGLMRSLMVLIVMLVLVIVSVHCQGWKLTKWLGGFMFLFYILFLAQAIYFELPFDICIS